MKRLFAVMLPLLSLAAALPAAGRSDDQDDPRTLTVQGQGKASAIPDIAVISAEVSHEGPELDPVLARVRRDMQKVTEALKVQGLAEKDIQTQMFQVQPKLQNDGKGNMKRVGHVVANRVSAKIRDLARTGKVLSAVLSAGATSVDGPDFELDNPQAVEREALAAATRDAQSKAKTVADAAGVKLGVIRQINPQSIAWPMPRQSYGGMLKTMAMSAEMAQEPISAGEQTLTGYVSITYEIQ